MGRKHIDRDQARCTTSLLCCAASAGHPKRPPGNHGQLFRALLMCLAVPMRITEVDRFTARCEAKGVSREVSLMMLQDEPLQVGDFVMVHLGYALQKMSEEEALAAWKLYDEILAAPGS